MNLEIIIRRLISVVLFVGVLFSPITLLEVIAYSIRWMVNRKTFPKYPYSYEFIKKMW
jgi:hypothetical protein